ncbi:acyl carrier protein [Idiomarina xiamenensis]|uniref:Phosphopantetheine-binding protein n=1 Tax=Idiomarina xiamenensis 10-D-4 TaxID=740709 RepID=K2JC35_9GAMM|nr:acyl carrier protein [Idiomarina xiamenensis]EKE80861.1 phosphopantetheine-binding protein [Idiomarina xiamenensis 10-D-4]
MQQNKELVRAFFGRFFETGNLTDDLDIFKAGFVNSLFAMQLIGWIEKNFSTTVSDEDLNLANFNSVNAIANFIERKGV